MFYLLSLSCIFQLHDTCFTEQPQIGYLSFLFARAPLDAKTGGKVSSEKKKKKKKKVLRLGCEKTL